MCPATPGGRDTPVWGSVVSSLVQPLEDTQVFVRGRSVPEAAPPSSKIHYQMMALAQFGLKPVRPGAMNQCRLSHLQVLTQSLDTATAPQSLGLLLLLVQLDSEYSGLRGRSEPGDRTFAR